MLCNFQGGHGTGKTGNLAVNFSRQGKHREFSKLNFYTGKMVMELFSVNMVVC